jgi:hypothetical protein
MRSRVEGFVACNSCKLTRFARAAAMRGKPLQLGVFNDS